MGHPTAIQNVARKCHSGSVDCKTSEFAQRKAGDLTNGLRSRGCRLQGQRPREEVFEMIDVLS